MSTIRNLLIFLVAFGFAVSANAATHKQTTKHRRKAKVVQVVALHSVNINKADAKSFMRVKGIGPKKAEAIVKYRAANGKFKSVADLTKVRGIGLKRLDKIKSYLTV